MPRLIADRVYFDWCMIPHTTDLTYARKVLCVELETTISE